MCVCVCPYVTKLAATYLICESKVQCYKVPYGVPNVDFADNALFTSLASLADSKLLDFVRIVIA